MSIINKMLQELDRRKALGSAGGPVPPQEVHAVSAPGAGHEWFWWTLAVLALAAIGWVGWVAYQMRPQSLVTDLALNAGEEARRKAAATPAKTIAPPAQPVPEPVQQASPPPPELFKLALSIDGPIPERVVKPGASSASAQKQAAAGAGASRVSKREIPRSPAEETEALFRQGVALLSQGRISEEGRISQAREHFTAALAKQSGHEAAREALIAILIERRQLDERGDYAIAASVLGAARSSGASDADYQLFYGAVLQRTGRHAEAIEAFQRAAQFANQPGAIWIALGISLEATGRKAEALQSYRRSLGAGALALDARAYAESRIRALD